MWVTVSSLENPGNMGAGVEAVSQVQQEDASRSSGGPVVTCTRPFTTLYRAQWLISHGKEWTDRQGQLTRPARCEAP